MPSNQLPEDVRGQLRAILFSLDITLADCDRAESLIAPLIIEWARKDALPEGAKFFPTEGGIMFNGKVYYPADYVVTRSDIEAIHRDQAEKDAQIADSEAASGAINGPGAWCTARAIRGQFTPETTGGTTNG
jgi:hypothetical protein